MNFANPEATALEGIARFEAFLKSIGMPLRFADLGAKEEDIPSMVKQLCKRPSVGSFVKIGAKEAEAIYRLAL
jgi:alcohol dehydrogenase YqhD (iron-dependent ADH family)